MQHAQHLINVNSSKIASKSRLVSNALELVQMLITLCGGVFCFIVIDSNSLGNGALMQHIDFALLPTILASLLCYFIAQLVITMITATIDAILLCYCADVEYNSNCFYLPTYLETFVAIKDTDIKQ